MTFDPSPANSDFASEKPVSRRTLREQRERTTDAPSALVNPQTGFLGLGGYSAVIDEIAPVTPQTFAVPTLGTPRAVLTQPVDFTLPPRDVPVVMSAPAESAPVSVRPAVIARPAVISDQAGVSRADPADGPLRRRSSYVPGGSEVPAAVPANAVAHPSAPPSPDRVNDNQGLRRRERSERERRNGRQLRESSVPSALAAARQALAATAIAGSAFRRAQAGKKPVSKRAIAKRAFAGTAMLFALGIGVATTVPANAYFALPGKGTAESLITSASSVADAQRLTTGQSALGNVVRDSYGSSARPITAAAGIRTAPTFVNNPASPIQWPFPVGVPISDGFGPRASPGGFGSTDHKGVDFTPGGGTPIGVIADGQVSLVHTYDSGGLGVYVTVDHVIDGQKITSVYGHMLSGSIAVSDGQTVKVGQTLGLVGNTGSSTGNHLHLEIHVNGTPVDPYSWLQAHVKS